MDKQNPLSKKRCIVVGSVVLLYILIIIGRAAVIPMSIDESYSYRLYAHDVVLHPFSVFQIYIHSKGNNHLLNSFLMLIVDAFCQQTPYQEILVRLPSVCFGIVFSVSCGWLYLHKKIGTVPFVFLLGNNYLLEYFALARGYAMSAYFVLFAMLYYQSFCQDYQGSDAPTDISAKHYHDFICTSVFLLLAESAQTVVLLITFSVYLIMLYMTIKRKEVRFFLAPSRLPGLILIGIGHVFFGLYHILINLTDILYASHSDPFNSIFVGYVAQYVTGEAFRFCIAVIYCVLLIIMFIINRKASRTNWISVLVVVHVLVSVLLGYLTGKGFPAERVLLPAVPLLVFSLEEMIETYTALLKNKEKVLRIKPLLYLITILIMGYSMFCDLPAETTRDWQSTAEDKQYLYSLFYHHDKIDLDRAPYDYGIRYAFYTNQILYYYGYDLYEGELVDEEKVALPEE